MLRNVECDLTIPDELRLGSFANSFRIVRDGEGEYLIDFFVYSPDVSEATLVGRLRVQDSTLNRLREHLARMPYSGSSASPATGALK